MFIKKILLPILLIIGLLSLTHADEPIPTQKQKEKKIYPMGQKLFEKKCKTDINFSTYSEINALKASLINDKLCTTLKEQQLQAVTLYLWEVKRVNLMSKNNKRIEVAKDEKCPVCGMFTYKYPKWATQIFYKEGEHEQHYSFDGVKDLMKFYFDPMAWGNHGNAKKEHISKILVTDYYTQKAIDGTEAFYVVGSDILGPMGNELIPFAQQSDAKTFLDDHSGKTIVTFDKITKEEVYKLDQ
ncbi:nitrous oxide reductase accessory protein NosL [bacterium]|nr:nitrous oxide reductase accessory protein NosL [bacterium]MBU1958217.1 nitrous oxide reductase accessory protein NosL [bacterium]